MDSLTMTSSNQTLIITPFVFMWCQKEPENSVLPVCIVAPFDSLSIFIFFYLPNASAALCCISHSSLAAAAAAIRSLSPLPSLSAQ
jgi:hypothetical protein